MARLGDKTTIPLVWVFILLGVCGSVIVVSITASLSIGRLYQRVDDGEDARKEMRVQLLKLAEAVESTNAELAEIKSIMQGIRNDGRKKSKQAEYSDGLSWCSGGVCRTIPKGVEFREKPAYKKAGLSFSF